MRKGLRVLGKKETCNYLSAGGDCARGQLGAGGLEKAQPLEESTRPAGGK